MHGDKLKIIQELMEELAQEMEYGPDDLESRLGRSKPEEKGVTIMEAKGKGMMPALEKAEEKVGMDLDGDMEEGESSDHMDMVLGDEGADEGDMLKKRLMKLRG